MEWYHGYTRACGRCRESGRVGGGNRLPRGTTRLFTKLTGYQLGRHIPTTGKREKERGGRQGGVQAQTDFGDGFHQCLVSSDIPSPPLVVSNLVNRISARFRVPSYEILRHGRRLITSPDVVENDRLEAKEERRLVKNMSIINHGFSHPKYKMSSSCLNKRTEGQPELGFMS